MESILLTTIGLVFNMIGVILLYFYVPPIFTVFPDGSEIVTYNEEPEQAKQKAKIAKRNINISRIALIVIFVGFVFQLLGQLTI